MRLSLSIFASVLVIVLFIASRGQVCAQGEFRIKLSPAAELDQPSLVMRGVDGSFQVLSFHNPNSLIHQRLLIDALRLEKTQEQIDFSPAQKKALKSIRDQLTKDYAEIKKKFPGLSDKSIPKEVRKSMQKDLNDQYKKLREKANEEFTSTLLPHQLKLIKKLKFNQSVAHYGFSWTVSNQPFQKDIETTKEQAKILDKIKKETEAAIAKRIEEMRKAAKAKMLRALDGKQRKTIEELEFESPKNVKIKL